MSHAAVIQLQFVQEISPEKEYENENKNTTSEKI